MQKSFALAFVGSVSAHNLASSAALLAKSNPADVNHIGALGEAYHNAWKRCAEKSTDWLIGDLKLNQQDAAFDNGYYVEYAIKDKVTLAYTTFEEILGSYWPIPEFTDNDDQTFNVAFGDYEQVHAQSERVSGESELPEPYQRTTDFEWIKEHNHIVGDFDIELYEGVPPMKLRRNDAGYKQLYKLFYAIQQTSYFCDFTFESAQFVYEKFGDKENAKLVEEEREYQHSMWSFILKEQIAPVRWSMLMWTKFNIAEPSIHNTIKVFNADLESVIVGLKSLDEEFIAENVDFDYATEKANYIARIGTWVEAFGAWIGSCYNEHKPADNIIQTSSKVCQHGLEFSMILDGIKGSTSMWFDFLVPALDAYKLSDNYDEKVHDEAYENFNNAVYKVGKPHSFRCEFLWIFTRVRYFEIIPTWEISRVAVDTADEWETLTQFRTEMIQFPEVDVEGIYSHETYEEMEAKKNEIIQFLNEWANGDEGVFDSDGELHRKNLRNKTKELSKDALNIYDWYFNMAYTQMEWQDGESHPPTESSGYVWGSRDPPSRTRIARTHANSTSRTGWRQKVWRELVKFHFHTWRRI